MFAHPIALSRFPCHQPCLTLLPLFACMPQKDGQEIPTKKGISLPPDQFGKLAGAAAALSDALQAQDTRCEVHLSNKWVQCSVWGHGAWRPCGPALIYGSG